jgi:hypothetical protein
MNTKITSPIEAGSIGRQLDRRVELVIGEDNGATLAERT